MRRNLTKRLKSYDTPYVLKTAAPTTADTGYSVPTIWIDTVTDRIYTLTDITAGVATWNESATSAAPMTTSTDPAINAAVTTAIIDAYSGVVITLTAGGNAQTLQSPTITTAGKRFTVVMDDANGAYASEVNGITMSAGEAQGFIWDGSAWIAVTAVDADDITFTPTGDIVATNVQTAIAEVDTEKLAKASNLSDVANPATSFTNIKQDATESATGVLEKATTAETTTGTDTDRAVTPAGVTAKLGTQTDHGVLVGSGSTNAVTALAVGTNGQVIVGSTGADPTFATITDGEAITTTLGAGTLQIDVEDASETNKGALEISTDAEFAAQTETDKALVPSNMAEPHPVAGTTGDFSGVVKVDDVLTAINDGSYGVSWDESANSYVRTGALTGVAVSSSPGNSLLPIQAAMRRCILDDNGIVQYYLEPDNSYNRLGYAPEITGTDDAGTASKVSDTGVFTLAAAEYVGKYVHNTTDDTYALITAKDSNNVLSIDRDIFIATDTFEICTAGIGYGGDGQVMVEIPLFYHKYSYVGTTHTYDISLVPLEGFSVHPAFVKNGTIAPYIYPGAYEGSMYDASAGVMVPDANIEDAYTITSGDKLCSLSGQYPKTNDTRNEFRILAAMRGEGWRQAAYDLASAWQLLYLIEYASFQSQAMIGTGRTMFNTGAWEAANQGDGKYIGQCGYSNLDGNNTGATNRASAVSIAAINTDTDTSYHDYMSYRGIENIFGNVWEEIDGVNINEHLIYVCNDDSDFQDDTEEGYTALDVVLPAANNYQQTLYPTNRGFLPKTVGAPTTQIGDYYYQSTGWRVVRLGGSAVDGAAAGAFDLLANDDSAHGYVSIGGRLCR